MSLLCASWAISFGNKIITHYQHKEEEAGSLHLYDTVLVKTLHSFLDGFGL